MNGRPPGSPEVVGDPSEGVILVGRPPEVRKWSGDTPGGPELVERSSRKSESGR